MGVTKLAHSRRAPGRTCPPGPLPPPGAGVPRPGSERPLPVTTPPPRAAAGVSQSRPSLAPPLRHYMARPRRDCRNPPDRSVRPTRNHLHSWAGWHARRLRRAWVGPPSPGRSATPFAPLRACHPGRAGDLMIFLPGKAYTWWAGHSCPASYGHSCPACTCYDEGVYKHPSRQMDRTSLTMNVPASQARRHRTCFRGRRLGPTTEGLA